MDLTEQQFHRYARHLILDEVGEEGQERLLASRVLVVGAGGLGAPLLMYLAAAGVGTLGIVDDDTVDLSNLQRQVIHPTASVDRLKVESAAATIAALNPEIRVEAHPFRLTAQNAASLVAQYDVIADGSDNFPTRYLLNDAAWLAGRTLVSAAMLRFEGQLTTIRRDGEKPTACWRCLFPEPPPPGLVPRCEEAGILGALAGVMGSMQATEVLKELLGLGESMAGRLLLYDALGPTFRVLDVPRDPACALCGEHATIADLSLHAA